MRASMVGGISNHAVKVCVIRQRFNAAVHLLCPYEYPQMVKILLCQNYTMNTKTMMLTSKSTNIYLKLES